jgi:hypothetical protein
MGMISTNRAKLGEIASASNKFFGRQETCPFGLGELSACITTGGGQRLTPEDAKEVPGTSSAGFP